MTRLTIVSGTPQSATVNTAFANPLVVQDVDQYGNPVHRRHGDLHRPGHRVPRAPSPARRHSTSTATIGPTAGHLVDLHGQHRRRRAYNVVGLGHRVGARQLRPDQRRRRRPALAVTSGSPQSATVAPAFTNPLVATVTDPFSNPVSGATVTFTAPASGAWGTFQHLDTGPRRRVTSRNGRPPRSPSRPTPPPAAYNVTARATGHQHGELRPDQHGQDDR